MAALHSTAHAYIDIAPDTNFELWPAFFAWLEVRIIEGSDNQGSDNQGWTVLLWH